MKAPAFASGFAVRRYLLPTALLAAIGVGWLTSAFGIIVPSLLLGAMFVSLFLVLVFIQPRAGFVAFIIYCFLIMVIGRHIDGAQPGLVIDGLLLLIWLSTIFKHPTEINWTHAQNDLCLLTAVWFVLNLLELSNPAGASMWGWLYEMRGTALYWFLSVPLGYMVFYKAGDLRLFLHLVIVFSVLGTLYGIKQKLLGVNSAEQRWLDEGAASTHIIWGRLRVFSFYSEAAQFGASQAHVGIMCLILALGPFVWWKRILLGLASILLFYGMLISGTRGALFVVVVGIFLYLVLSKQLKILLLGGMLGLGALFALKYTSLGSSNADIVRLRTSLDPQDASFQVRLSNQAELRSYLATRPFGGGVGVIGAWGTRYNADKYLSTIAPDSLFVKIWAEYGIIGFVIWLGIMLYILGKCCGIVWNIQEPGLRQKLLALTAGFGGILVSSYGNEIMNQMPSGMIVYVSWVFIFLGPSLDKPRLTLVDHG